MKVEIVLVIVFIALVKGSDSDETEVTKPIHHHVKLGSSGTKQWKPHSPKNDNIQRFIVTTKSTITRSTPSRFQLSHKTTFKTTTPTIRAKNSNFWKLATTRRPFMNMKHVQFTVTPLSTTKRPEVSEETRRKHKSMLFVKKIDDATNNDDSSEEMAESINIQNKEEKEKYDRPTISPIRRLRSKVIKFNKIDDISKSKDTEIKPQIEVTPKNNSESEFSSEEVEDREEFIFVKPKEIKQNGVDVMKDDSIESEENTTVKEEEIKVRHKRSINVIEEENLGTTVSGFKFTGKVAPLSSDLIFRNINT
ncbi:uncharacterized protein [Epargyreus clarus]|uniref:uncharacterized protein n=1 Tax=Epargyreus clarus TaxID=520877 RepID=UPI003C2CF149